MTQENILNLLYTWLDGYSRAIDKRDLLSAARKLSRLPKKNLPNFGYRVFQIDIDSTIKTWSQFTNRVHKKNPESYSASKQGAHYFARGVLSTDTITIVLGVELKPNDIMFYVPGILDDISLLIRQGHNAIYDYLKEDEVVTVPGILKNRLLSGDAYLVGYQDIDKTDSNNKMSIYYLDRPKRIFLNAQLPWETK